MIVEIQLCPTQDSAAWRCKMQQGKVVHVTVANHGTGKPHHVP